MAAEPQPKRNRTHLTFWKHSAPGPEVPQIPKTPVESVAETPVKEPHDFLYHLEQHTDDDLEYSDDKVDIFMNLALEHRIEPYSSQTERGKRIIDAALFSSRRSETPEEYVDEFNRLREWIPKIEEFSARVYKDAKDTFAGNVREEDWRFLPAFNEWRKTAIDDLRRGLSAIADAAFGVLRDSRKVSSRWYDTIINSSRSEEELKHEGRERAYYEGGRSG